MAAGNGRLEEASRQGDRQVGQGRPGGVPAEELRHPKSIDIFRRPEEVPRFLESNPSLSPLLAEAHEKIEENFESRPEVVLEVVRDPEIRGPIQMFAYVVTGLTPKEASRRLQRFDREWFLREVPRAKGVLNCDLEFR